jgi:uncharacterized membrane protein YgcG
MTRRPNRPDDDDGLDADLQSTVADLDRYLADSDSGPARGFADRVMEAVESEPIPRRGVLAVLATTFSSDRGRVVLMAATVAVAVLAVVATGQLARILPTQFGSPQPSPSVQASPEPSPSITPSPSPRVSPSPSAEPSGSGSDDESESPDKSDDADESPSATDDKSGSGGGGGDDGGDNSAPGGGSSSSPEASD